MNDEERREWVQNDEPLYREWQKAKTGLYKWVKANRKLIDSVIERRHKGDVWGPVHVPKFIGTNMRTGRTRWS